MWQPILIKAFEELVKAIQKILRKKNLDENCKKSAELISQAIRELLKLNPDAKKAKALLARAEKLCEENIEELLKAKGFLKTFENANVMAAKVPSAAKKAAAKKVAARKPVAKKAVARKPVARKPVARKPIARKASARRG